jgi:hypothetical protein
VATSSGHVSLAGVAMAELGNDQEIESGARGFAGRSTYDGASAGWAMSRH